jgi:hypothetical protein
MKVKAKKRKTTKKRSMANNDHLFAGGSFVEVNVKPKMDIDSDEDSIYF